MACLPHETLPGLTVRSVTGSYSGGGTATIEVWAQNSDEAVISGGHEHLYSFAGVGEPEAVVMSSKPIQDGLLTGWRITVQHSTSGGASRSTKVWALVVQK